MGIKIIGISCFYHDSAVSLVEDGKVEFAIQEERLTRLKHDKSFPKYGLKNCLKYLNSLLKNHRMNTEQLNIPDFQLQLHKHINQ